jgi:hypothetical protein
VSFTVVPIHNLKLEPGTRVPFGNGFVLQDVPGWLKNDREILNDLSRHERLWTLESQHAWVAEYDALSIGEPDPSWKGSKPKSIQQTKFDSVILANIALWLMEPTNVCFTNGFDAISWNVPERPEKLPIAQQVQPCNRLLCHPKDVGNRISVAKIVKAGDLHAVLFSIPRDNAVWESLRATWAALTMNSVDLRYSLFWIGLEALFGADDAGEIGYKLAQRISFCTGATSVATREEAGEADCCKPPEYCRMTVLFTWPAR